MTETFGNAPWNSAQCSYYVQSVRTINSTISNSAATPMFVQEWIWHPAGRIDNVRNVFEEECSLKTVRFCVVQSVVLWPIISSGHVVYTLQFCAVGAVVLLVRVALDIRHCVPCHHMQQAQRGLVICRFSLQWVLMNIYSVRNFTTESKSKRGPLMRSKFSNRFTVLTELTLRRRNFLINFSTPCI